MNKLISLLTLLISSAIFAQNSYQYTIELSGESKLQSEVIPFKMKSEPSFVGLSAYIPVPNLKVQLMYRVRTTTWGEWKSFHLNDHGETPNRTAYEADPLTESFESIQFKADQPITEKVIFRLFVPGPKESTTELNSGSALCSCIQPAYCDRWCWCPDSSCTTGYTPDSTQPTHVIVHHSAGFNTSNDFKDVVAYYWDLHVNTNGWDDIGYNWLIDPNGAVYEGRGSGVTGAHFSCMNSETTGICLIGNYQSTPPPAAAVQALKDFVTWESCDKNIVINGTSLHASSQLVLPHLSGHRDGNSSTVGCPSGTVCPGSDLYSQLPALANSIAANPCLTGVWNEEFALNTISLYPNPTDGMLHLEYPGRVDEIILTDMLGNNVFKGTRASKELNITPLPVGIYILNIVTEGENHSFRVIKQ